MMAIRVSLSAMMGFRGAFAPGEIRSIRWKRIDEGVASAAEPAVIDRDPDAPCCQCFGPVSKTATAKTQKQRLFDIRREAE